MRIEKMICFGMIYSKGKEQIARDLAQVAHDEILNTADVLVGIMPAQTEGKTDLTYKLLKAREQNPNQFLIGHLDGGMKFYTEKK